MVSNGFSVVIRGPLGQFCSHVFTWKKIGYICQMDYLMWMVDSFYYWAKGKQEFKIIKRKNTKFTLCMDMNFVLISCLLWPSGLPLIRGLSVMCWCWSALGSNDSRMQWKESFLILTCPWWMQVGSWALRGIHVVLLWCEMLASASFCIALRQEWLCRWLKTPRVLRVL